MLKFSNIVGVINLIFTFVLVSSLISFISNNNTSSSLALFLTSLSFVLIAIVLTIPFVIFIKKKGFEIENFYTLTHLCFCGSSVISFIVFLLFQ